MCGSPYGGAVPIIPFITEGEEPTVVFDPRAFRLKGGAVRIVNADANQLDPTNTDCNASYDLRVGKNFRDHRDLNGSAVGNEGIKLLPGMAVIVETKEEVHFPNTAFGQIAPKVSLLQKGISNTPSKIDPGYSGRLLITVFNHGRQTYMLKPGERFCSMFVTSVEAGIRPYTKPGQQIQGSAVKGYLRGAMDWIGRHNPELTGVLILITALSLLRSFF